jgi:hypothetical protein
MKRHTTDHPAMPRFHRWIRRWFGPDIDFHNLEIDQSDIELDLASGRD